MRETLYIRLRSASPDAPTDYRLDGEAAGRVEQAALSTVLDLAPGKRLIVIVPADQVRLETVELPIRNAAKLRKAVPYALEDLLAEDVDTLHFAVGARQGDGSHGVAVLAHTVLQQWLAPFLERELRPEAFIPENLCLPTAPETWSLLAEAERAIVRSGPCGGFSCAMEDLQDYLTLADPDGQQALQILIPDGVSTDFSELKQPTELLPGYRSALDALVDSLDTGLAINLLQGEYSQAENLARYWRPWMLPGALAASALLIAVLVTAVEGARIEADAIAQEQANAQRFRQIFPSQQRIVDLDTQLAQQLAQLDGGGQSGLLELMGSLDDGLKAAKGLSLQAMQFRDGDLFLSLTGTDLQALERLRAWYAEYPTANLEVQTANAGSDGVQIRVRLSAA